MNKKMNNITAAKVLSKAEALVADKGWSTDWTNFLEGPFDFLAALGEVNDGDSFGQPYELLSLSLSDAEEGCLLKWAEEDGRTQEEVQQAYLAAASLALDGSDVDEV